MGLKEVIKREGGFPILKTFEPNKRRGLALRKRETGKGTLRRNSS